MSTPDNDIPAPPEKDPTTEWQTRGANPFTVYTRLDCAPVGMEEDLPQSTIEALTRAEEYAVEQAFWTGVTTGADTATVYPHLAALEEYVDSSGVLMQPAATIITETPLEATDALGAIERALGDCYPGGGMIHVPAGLAARFGADSLVTARAGIQHTTLGNKVVFGRGYDGSGPDGSDDPGVSWIYATSDVFYQRSELEDHNFTEIFDRESSTIRALVERTYVVAWDCCLLAVPVIDAGDVEEVLWRVVYRRCARICCV
nr:hypothetical protein [uncultured bacterium]